VKDSSLLKWLFEKAAWLEKNYLLLDIKSGFLEILFILFALLFIPSGRNFIFFIFKKIWSFFSMLPGRQTTDLFRRYLNIGRYAFHDNQNTIYSKLRDQYPAKTGFVVLPMDMEYMDAGNSKKRYRDQLEELRRLQKANDGILPFIFADPRRMAALPGKEKNHRPGDKPYFVASHHAGKVTLEDCILKEYLEADQPFRGIKIYPALGYYPFDESLLPLWKYAADNKIPILTHCIRGTIFYRGKKKKEWNRHPILLQAAGKQKYEPLVLPGMKNADYSVNFTHPLNYLCLLDEFLLRRWVAKCSDSTKSLFGYSDDHTPLLYNLHHLKICFGHFGGDDEWALFFERDRDLHSSQLINDPDIGVRFLFNKDGEFMPGKCEQIWKDADWYTIICSLMLQYPNVYADISYILHSEQAILSLLKKTLTHQKLKKRVLYGSDFYVVRNHKSDKGMLAQMVGGLSEEEFDRIARYNPITFLERL
jgi:predicted TIM-barrel fold metal-dependent hydrolase